MAMKKVYRRQNRAPYSGKVYTMGQRKRITRRRVRKGNNYAGKGNGAIAKFSRNPFHGEEVKTLDTLFTGAYNAVYTPDQQPCQVLNLNTGTASVQCLNLIQQGAGTCNRIGHKTSMKSLRIRLAISPENAVNLVEISNARVMILYDRTPEGTYTAANSILSNIIQTNVTQAGSMYDNLNPNFFDRFVVLMDKFLVLQPFNATGQNNNYQTGPTCDSSFLIDEYIKLKNLESVYGNTANNLQTANPMTMAYVQTGALLILSYGISAAANMPWGLIGTCRLRFNDN